MTDIARSALVKAALEARGASYSPYSGFSVGAALLCGDGSVYRGVNIENAAYPVTICAERTALFAAVADGKRDFTAIAVAGGKNGEPPEDYCFPCGSCRQAMREFCAPDFCVIVVKNENETAEYTLSQLLPHSFSL